MSRPGVGAVVSSSTSFPERASRSRCDAPGEPMSSQAPAVGAVCKIGRPGSGLNRRSSLPEPASQTRTSPADMEASRDRMGARQDREAGSVRAERHACISQDLPTRQGNREDFLASTDFPILKTLAAVPPAAW